MPELVSTPARSGQPMLVGIFLNYNPMGVCHVTAQLVDTTMIIVGDCILATANSGRCKHTDRVIRNYHENGGSFLTEVDAHVTAEMVAESKKLPGGFRDLIIHTCKISVV